MDLSKYILEAVNIICLDGQSFTGRVKEVNTEEAFLVIRCPVEGTHKVYAKEIKEILVYDQYDPPLPPRYENPTEEDKEKGRQVIMRYRKLAAAQGKPTDGWDEMLEEL